MHKKYIKILIYAALLCLGMSYFSFAQGDEEVGFVKRLWRKIFRKSEPKEEKAQPKAKFVATEKKTPGKQEGAAPKKAPPPRPARENMLERISYDLSVYGSQIASRVSFLAEETDEKGNLIYKFIDKTGKHIELDQLSEDDLFIVYRRVIAEANLAQNERVNKQLQQMRHIQPPKIPQVPKPPQPVVQPPAIPKAYTPPKIPPPPQPPPTQRR